MHCTALTEQLGQVVCQVLPQVVLLPGQALQRVCGGQEAAVRADAVVGEGGLDGVNAGDHVDALSLQGGDVPGGVFEPGATALRGVRREVAVPHDLVLSLVLPPGGLSLTLALALALQRGSRGHLQKGTSLSLGLGLRLGLGC